MKDGKTKFNKDRCAECIYRFRSSFLLLGCNYAVVTGETCLRRNSDGKVIDIRGNDYNHCALYQKGQRIKEREEAENES